MAKTVKSCDEPNSTPLMVSTRLTGNLVAQFMEFAKQHSMTNSELLRACVRGYLDSGEKEENTSCLVAEGLVGGCVVGDDATSK